MFCILGVSISVGVTHLHVYCKCIFNYELCVCVINSMKKNACPPDSATIKIRNYNPPKKISACGSFKWLICWTALPPPSGGVNSCFLASEGPSHHHCVQKIMQITSKSCKSLTASNYLQVSMSNYLPINQYQTILS